jgi:predicted nucleotidyltransferase
VGKVLEARRRETSRRLRRLRTALKDAAKLVDGRACVYATGSFARGEASEHSDLDLFIIGRTEDGQRALPNLDEICLKADLIETTRRLTIPDFSGDGEYLQHYAVGELVDSLGTARDDATNTFTARLLLLLESRPLVGEDTYGLAINDVLSAYWRDYEDHAANFMPAFLANDILRIWRTFCVNYEARTKTEPPEKKAKRKLKNYKLKHSRLLTCYSALASLLALFKEQGTVSPADARDLVQRSPTERLEWLQSYPSSSSSSGFVDRLLKQYERFLVETDAPEGELIKRFLQRRTNRRLIEQASEFGNEMFALLDAIGRDSGGTVNQFYRLLVV